MSDSDCKVRVKHLFGTLSRRKPVRDPATSNPPRGPVYNKAIFKRNADIRSGVVNVYRSNNALYVLGDVRKDTNRNRAFVDGATLNLIAPIYRLRIKLLDKAKS